MLRAVATFIYYRSLIVMELDAIGYFLQCQSCKYSNTDDSWVKADSQLKRRVQKAPILPKGGTPNQIPKRALTRSQNVTLGRSSSSD